MVFNEEQGVHITRLSPSSSLCLGNTLGNQPSMPAVPPFAMLSEGSLILLIMTMDRPEYPVILLIEVLLG